MSAALLMIAAAADGFVNGVQWRSACAATFFTVPCFEMGPSAMRLSESSARCSCVLMSGKRELHSRVHVQEERWEDNPCGGTRSAYLRAKCVDGGMIGGCGVEVARMTADGLTGGDRAGEAPRAVLSGELHVEVRYRRQGVAARLLRAAEHKARTWGCGELLLMVRAANVPARALYSKLGYTAHPHTHEHGGQICMSRKLFAPDAHTLRSVLPPECTVRVSRR